MGRVTAPTGNTGRPPARSGFCGIRNGPDSHARCRKSNCPCRCGLGIHALAATTTPEGDTTVSNHANQPPTREPGEYVGPSNFKGTRDYAWYRLPDGALTMSRAPETVLEGIQR